MSRTRQIYVDTHWKTVRLVLTGRENIDVELDPKIPFFLPCPPGCQMTRTLTVAPDMDDFRAELARFGAGEEMIPQIPTYTFILPGDRMIDTDPPPRMRIPILFENYVPTPEEAAIDELCAIEL